MGIVVSCFERLRLLTHGMHNLVRRLLRKSKLRTSYHSTSPEQCSVEKKTNFVRCLSLARIRSESIRTSSMGCPHWFDNRLVPEVGVEGGEEPVEVDEFIIVRFLKLRLRFCPSTWKSSKVSWWIGLLATTGVSTSIFRSELMMISAFLK